MRALKVVGWCVETLVVLLVYSQLFGCTGRLSPDSSIWILIRAIAANQGAGLPADFSFADLAPQPKLETDILPYANLLPPDDARDLLVWFFNHMNILDMRLHSLDTCPFLAYSPAYNKHKKGDMSDLEWAQFLHKFFKAKHEEEKDIYNCDCEGQLKELIKISMVVGEVG